MLPHIIWGLWKERNNRIFRDASLSPVSLFFKIISAIRENFRLAVENIDILSCVIVSDYDSGVAVQWKLSFDIAKPLKKDKMAREGVVWYSPPPSWHKINFDGSAKGNLSPTGCGGVLRDCYGKLVSAVALPLGIQTNHFVEVVVAYHGIKLAREKGVSKLLVKGDSLNIINYLRKCLSPSCTIEIFILDAHAILQDFNEVYIFHAFREANGVADYMVNHGVTSVGHWEANDIFPIDLINFLNNEKM